MFDFSRLEVGIYNHHSHLEFSDECELVYSDCIRLCLQKMESIPAGPDHVLSALDAVEISLIDDDTIDQIHRDFMNIEGATDVITFHHGEIMISLDTTKSQAELHHQPFEQELLRYMVHGLLHLHGYLDYEVADREEMFRHQETLVAFLSERISLPIIHA